MGFIGKALLILLLGMLPLSAAGTLTFNVAVTIGSASVHVGETQQLIATMTANQAATVHLIRFSIALDNHQVASRTFRDLDFKATEAITRTFEWAVPNDAPIGTYSFSVNVLNASGISKAIADASFKVVKAATNGTCGEANGAAVASSPTTGLCSAGTASTISGNLPWVWACAGSEGGPTAQCSTGTAFTSCAGVPNIGSPRTVSCFLNSLGVNHHLTWTGTGYDNVPLERKQLQYLGINLVRDGVPNDPEKFIELARTGIRFDLIVGNDDEMSGDELSNELAPMARLEQAIAGSIYSIEGPNELNTQTVKWKGVSTGAQRRLGPAAAVSLQHALYGAVKKNPVLGHLPVVNSSFNMSGPAYQSYIAAAGDMSAAANVGNWHVYTGDWAIPAVGIMEGVRLARQMVVDKPLFITEFGFATPQWVTESQQAYLTLKGIADSYVHGAENIFIYELMDGKTGSSNDQHNFGLFHSDGTAKPAAFSIHNMTTILAIAGTGSTQPSGPAPTVSDLSATSSSLTLLDGNDDYVVLIWDEGKGSHATINLSESHSTVNVYDPVRGGSPVQTYANISQLTVDIGVNMLIITTRR